MYVFGKAGSRQSAVVSRQSQFAVGSQRASPDTGPRSLGLAPVSGGDESGPVEGMRAQSPLAPAVQEAQTRCTHGLDGVQSIPEPHLIQIPHELPS